MSTKLDAPLGLTEVAELAGCGVSNIKRLRLAGRFPEPDGTLAMGPWWLTSTIEKWMKQPRPQGRPKGERHGSNG